MDVAVFVYIFSWCIDAFSKLKFFLNYITFFGWEGSLLADFPHVLKEFESATGMSRRAGEAATGVGLIRIFANI
jgi:hypothetical protein